MNSISDETNTITVIKAKETLNFLNFLFLSIFGEESQIRLATSSSALKEVFFFLNDSENKE